MSSIERDWWFVSRNMPSSFSFLFCHIAISALEMEMYRALSTIKIIIIHVFLLDWCQYSPCWATLRRFSLLASSEAQCDPGKMAGYSPHKLQLPVFFRWSVIKSLRIWIRTRTQLQASNWSTNTLSQIFLLNNHVCYVVSSYSAYWQSPDTSNEGAAQA